MIPIPARFRRWLTSGSRDAGDRERSDDVPAASEAAGWYWLQHPLVRERVNASVSGRPHVDPYARLAEFLKEHDYSFPLGACVTLGCGSGGLERDLLSRGLVREIDAYDRSEAAIAEARDQAARLNLVPVRYHLGEPDPAAWPDAHFDCILTHSWLHSVDVPELLLDGIRRALKPDGILHLNEFFGPSLFQWTDAQLDLMNEYLDTLPDRLAQVPGRGRKPRVERPTKEAMVATGSPPAIRSAELRDALRGRFEIVEDRPFGGTLLHMGLGGIAQNFDPARPDDAAALRRLFDLEDEMIGNGTIGSDFAIVTAVPAPRPVGARHFATAGSEAEPGVASTRRLRVPPEFNVSGLDLTVSRADTMLGVHDAHYVSVGQSALAAIERALEGREPTNILDLPCGFGRVTRALRARFPHASITVSDLDQPGVDFSASQFGARGAYSVRDFRELVLGERYDLIWVGSLVTHLPTGQTMHFLRALARHLTPWGRAVISVHGPSIIPRLREKGYGLLPEAAKQVIGQFETTGFGYADYPSEEHLYGISLSNDHYGISLTDEPWMRQALAKSGLALVRYEHRTWDDHHDVVIANRPPSDDPDG